MACAAVSVSALGLCTAIAAQGQASNMFGQKTRTFHTADDFARVTGGRVRIQRELDPLLDGALRRLPIRLPVAEFTVIAVESPSITWIGTPQGAIRLTPDKQTAEYFAGQRWLPDDHVTGIGFEGKATWLETRKGLARIEYVPMTLPDKSRAFVRRVQERHNRWGLTAS